MQQIIYLSRNDKHKFEQKNSIQDLDCSVYSMMTFYFRRTRTLLSPSERRNMTIKINSSPTHSTRCLEGNSNVNRPFTSHSILKWKSKYGNFVKFIGSLIPLGGSVGEGEVETTRDGEYRAPLSLSFFSTHTLKRRKICVSINLRWVSFLISW